MNFQNVNNSHTFEQHPPKIKATANTNITNTGAASLAKDSALFALVSSLLSATSTGLPFAVEGWLFPLAILELSLPRLVISASPDMLGREDVQV